MKPKQDYRRLIEQAENDIQQSHAELCKLRDNFRRLNASEHERVNELINHIQRMKVKLNHYNQKLYELIMKEG